MACYHPVPAFQRKPGAELRLHPPLGTANLSIPCGYCVGCRSTRAQQWSYRIMHEARKYDHNQFVTFTYSDEHLPKDMSLVPRHLQLFFKRLRSANGPVRYFACGEYGTTTFRPHYHAILFGMEFKDGIPAGRDLFQSNQLDDLWSHGACRYGSVTHQSARYVASYSVKKLDWKKASADGVILEPPFARMSLRPGIGADWLEGFKADLAQGYLVVDGQKVGIPRYYKQLIRRVDPQTADMIDARCAASGRLKAEDNAPERRQAAEQIHLARQREATQKGSL